MQWCESPQKYAVLLFVCINILIGIYTIKRANTKALYKKFSNNKLYTTIIIIFIVSSISISTQNVFCQLLFSKGNIYITIIYLTGFTLYYIGLSLLFLFYVLYLNNTYTAIITSSPFKLFLILFVIQVLCTLSTETFLLFNQINVALVMYIIFFIINIISNILLLYILGRTIHILGQEIKDDYHYKIDAMSRSIYTTCTNNTTAVEITALTIDLSSTTKSKSIYTTCTNNTTAVEITALTIDLSSTTKSKSIYTTCTNNTTAVEITALTIDLSSTTKSKSSLLSISKNNSKSKPRKRSKKSKILSKIVRITVFAMISFISSNLTNILGIYRLSAVNNQILWISHLIIIIINQTIIIICLYLTHKHSRKLYQKYCTKLHFCIYHLFVAS
eukprot:322136_1